MHIEHKNIHMNIKSESQLVLKFEGSETDIGHIGGSGIAELKITPQWLSFSRHEHDGSPKMKTFDEFIAWLEE